MPKEWIRALATDEDGTGSGELALFLAFAILTGVGFLCFGAGQFRAAFMPGATAARF